MSKLDLTAKAKVLWDTAQCRSYSPAWEQLGEVTKGVWIERVSNEPEKSISSSTPVAHKSISAPKPSKFAKYLK